MGYTQTKIVKRQFKSPNEPVQVCFSPTHDMPREATHVWPELWALGLMQQQLWRATGRGGRDFSMC